MKTRIQQVVESKLVHDVADSVKHAAINMVGSLILVGIVKGIGKGIEIAADAVSKNSQQV